MAAGDDAGPRALHLACFTSGTVDPALLSQICTEFREALASQPGYRVIETHDGPLSDGPGLEIDVIRATAMQLDLAPTWVDAAGARTGLPSAGLVIADAALTGQMRRRLFLDLLGQIPE